MAKSFKFNFNLIFKKSDGEEELVRSETAVLDNQNLVNMGNTLLNPPSSVYSCLQEITEAARPYRNSEMTLGVKIGAGTVDLRIPFHFQKRAINVWNDVRCKFLLALLEGV